MSTTTTIPFTVVGHNGPPLIFLHANGYPPTCYQPLLSHLAQHYQVLAMHLRPLWPDSDPRAVHDWRVFSEDLLAFLHQQNFTEPVRCAGHSIGANVILRAALWQPERFAGIALIEPVLFPPYFIRLFQVIRALRLLEYIPPLRTARRRRTHFDDLDRLFQNYRQKAVFRYFNDQALRAYIQGITCPDENGGWRLRQSVEWEVRIYAAGVWRDMEIWRGLPDLRVPTYMLRGAETDAFPPRAVRLVRRKNPQIPVETIQQATHLLPLEHPQEVARRIHEHFAHRLTGALLEKVV